MAKWMSLDSSDRSWRFYCSACGGVVYWPQATRGMNRKKRRCVYPSCPYCLERMETGAETAEKKAAAGKQMRIEEFEIRRTTGE